MTSIVYSALQGDIILHSLFLPPLVAACSSKAALAVTHKRDLFG